MRTDPARSTPLRIAAASSSLVLAALAACGGSALDMPAADASSAGDASLGDEGEEGSAVDGGACPLEADADLAANGNGPGQVAAAGGANGDSVDCTFCGVGVNLAASADSSFPTLLIASFSGSTMTCSAPGDASGVFLQGTLALEAATPGVYQGSPSSFVESSDCDNLVMGYDLPSDGGTIDCGDSGFFHGPPSCPAGCFSACADAGDAGVICSPCESSQPGQGVEYGLYDGCGTGTAGYGSWTVTLTSVAPAEIPPDSGVLPGVQFDVVHGSLSATLLDGPSGPSVTVTLDF